MSKIRLSGGLGAIAWTNTPSSNWTCTDWLYWHQALVAAGKNGSFPSHKKYDDAAALQNANAIFLEWWKSTATFSQSNFCGYKSDWFNYFQNVGLGDELLSYFQAIFTPVASGAAKVTQTATDTIESVASAVSNTASVSKYVLPVVLIAGVGLAGLFVYNNYVKVPKRSLSGVRKRRRKKIK
jgi:hypothetical protein